MNAHAFPLRADEATVRTFLDIVHQQAAHALQCFDQPGELQLVRIHSGSSAVVSTRFKIGDVDGMVRAALDAAASGENVYIEPRTIKEVASGTGRGGLDDTRAVFALVVDSDADKGKAASLSIEPSLEVETSPGNTHCWFFLDRALPPDEAQPLGAAIRAATGADSATGVITQPYRVAGTPNFPSARKLARGRTATPTRILAMDRQLWTKDALIEAFPAHPHRACTAASSTGIGGGQRTVESLVAETVTPAVDRSARFHSAVNAAVRVDLTPDGLEALMRQHPHGCASKYLHGRDRLREEIERSWAKAQERTQEDPEAAAAVDQLNEHYSVVQDGGKTLVLSFELDVRDGRTRMISGAAAPAVQTAPPIAGLFDPIYYRRAIGR